MVVSDDPRIPLCGYAKLEGESMEYLVRKLEVVLGRASKTGQADVVLGDNMNISRQHAKIAWNPSRRSWELVVMGKNGVTVGSTLYTPTSPAYTLKSQDVISVADKAFFFLLPKPVTHITKRELEQLSATGGSKRTRLSTGGPPATVEGASAVTSVAATSGMQLQPHPAGPSPGTGGTGMPPAAQQVLLQQQQQHQAAVHSNQLRGTCI